MERQRHSPFQGDSRSCRIIELKRQIALLQKYERNLQTRLLSIPQSDVSGIRVRSELEGTLKGLKELNEELKRAEAEP